MKPKQWLAQNGHIADPNQRGRLSAAHKALIEKAVLDGADIDGYAVSKAVSDTPAPKVERVSVDPNRIADVPDESRPETDWEAHTNNGPIGMRTVCNTCHSSLTYCHCPHPKVWLDSDTEGVVFFRARKSPLPKKKW